MMWVLSNVGLWVISMKLYAVFRDGELYRASYKQNVPFYETEVGAQRALQSVTNRRSLPMEMRRNEKEAQDYLAEQKKRFEIREFSLDEGRVISK